MRSQVRTLAITLALSVAPVLGVAQTSPTRAPGFEPGGIGPGGTAWSGSMPRQNVDITRNNGPRTDRGLGIDTHASPPPNARGGGPADPTVHGAPTEPEPGTNGGGVIGDGPSGGATP